VNFFQATYTEAIEKFLLVPKNHKKRVAITESPNGKKFTNLIPKITSLTCEKIIVNDFKIYLIK